MKDCERCLNSRPIISENGYHHICCLSQRTAANCMTGKKNKFVTLEKDESGNIKTKI